MTKFNMDIASLHMDNLLLKKVTGSLDDIEEIVMQSEELVFLDGYYKNGPTIIEMDPAKFNKKEQEFNVYVPVSDAVTLLTGEDEGKDFIKEMDLPAVLVKRIPYDETIEEVLDKMIEYLNHENLNYGPKLMFMMHLIYDEYWLDIMIPINVEDKK